MMAFRAGCAGVVGKLPSRAEYLPVPASAPGFAAFDAWLTDAAEWAAERAGPNWVERFAQGAMHGFVFREPAAPPDGILCGAVVPSCDSAGRQFPLALAVPLQLSPELLARCELLPFVLEAVWAEATQALAELRAGGLTVDAISSISVNPDMDAAEAADLYGRWAAELPLAELWLLLGPALAKPEATLRLLFEALAPLRGVERPQTTLSLRLPLGVAGGAALCFWLDVVRRCVGWNATVPSLFWSHDGHDGAAVVHLGRPPRDTLAELWLPTGSRDAIADMTVEPAGEVIQACRVLPPSAQALLSAPAVTVSQFLAGLA